MIAIHLVTDPPTDGQFLQVWEYNGVLWSRSCRWHEGRIEQYSEEVDDFQPLEPLASGCIHLGYIVKG